MNPLDAYFYLPILATMLAVGGIAGRASGTWRRILAVLFGILAGDGIAGGVNAVLTSLLTWHPRNGALVSTGDIQGAMMVAGGSVGLLASLFIRDPIIRDPIIRDPTTSRVQDLSELDNVRERR